MVAFLIYVLVDFLKKLAVICFKIGICIDVNTKNGAVKFISLWLALLKRVNRLYESVFATKYYNCSKNFKVKNFES